MNSTPVTFDRPIIILACPRSGSSLLFETLAQAQDIWTIGTESHAVIEHIPEFSTVYNGFNSNELTENDGNDESISLLKSRFQSQLRNCFSQPYTSTNKRIRFLEKTPKNSLRIRFLHKVFPDALFIHLIRDPKDNISSIIDGWHSRHFITYPNLPGFDNRWSYLLPPNWQALQGKSIAEIATYQWKVCNETIQQELQQLPKNKWHMVHYQDFLDNTPSVVERLCQFIGIAFDQRLAQKCNATLPYSQFTLTKPEKNKWLKNKSLLENNISSVHNITSVLNTNLKMFSQYKLDIDLG